MSTNNKMTILPFAVVLLWPVMAAAQGSPVSKPRSAVTLEALLSRVKLGDRIPLIATLTNISDSDIELGWRGIYGYPREIEHKLLIRVTDSDGKPVSLNEYGSQIYGQSNPVGPLICCYQWKPGETFIEESDLNKEFEFSKPGKYTAQATWRAVYNPNVSNIVSFTLVGDERDAQAPRPSFTISIAATTTSISPGSPLVVSATMTNVSGHNVPVRREYNNRSGKEIPHRLIAHVRGKGGSPVPETTYGKTVHTEQEMDAYGF